MPLASLSALDVRKKTGFPPGYPADVRTFYSPVDDVHGALLNLIESATSSLVCAMYALTDPQLADAMREKMNDDSIFVQLTLDSTRAADVYEHRLLAQESYPATSIAIGKSERSSIMHLKMLIVDGLDVATGSTNWSYSGEHLQDNQLTVIRNPLVAQEARARVDIVHAHMIAVAAKKGANSEREPSGE